MATGPLEKGTKVISFVSIVLGQVPGVLNFFNIYPLYQRSIYQGRELFLILPLVVGIFATWLVMKHPKAMAVIFVVAFVGFCVSFGIFEFVDVLSPMHTVNWLLFFSSCALAAAVITRSVAEWLGILAG